MGWVVEPREDRWHRKPTAIYGGVAIYLAFAAYLLAWAPGTARAWILWPPAPAPCSGLGLWDDIFELKPQVKFMAQLTGGHRGGGLGLGFREIFPWVWLNVPLTLLWLVGVTNAVNILDNMDGLSSGVALHRQRVMLAAISASRGGPQMGPVCRGPGRRGRGLPHLQLQPGQDLHGRLRFSLFLGFTLAWLTILSTITAARGERIAP